MKATISATFVAGAIALVLVACGSPNKPSVSFASPAAAGPSSGTVVPGNQPVTLTIANAVRTSNQTATYTFEVARDGGFANVVARQDGVAEGANGTTSAQFSNLPPDSTYYWHARAKIDGTDGVFSPPGTFRVNTPVVFDKPRALTPGAEQDAFGPRPSFTVSNPPRSGPVTAVVYEFQIASNSTFSPVLTQGTVPEGGHGQTSFQPSIDLPEGSLYWHARPTDPASSSLGPYTDTVHFNRKQGVDLAHVVYLKGPNVANWPQTSTITNAYHSGGNLCIIHTKLGQWPATAFFETPGALEGNQWVLANIGGTWYAGAADWYRPGQGCKGVNNNIGVDSFDKQPLHGWHPQPGETIGVMSTTPARLYPAMKTIDQRTNVVFIKW